VSIQKVQAVAEFSPRAETSALFPAGLTVSMSFQDPDEMVERAHFWDMRQNQLGKGRFEGAFRGTHSARMQMNWSGRNQGLLLRGSIPSGTVVLSSIHRQAAPVFLRGVMLTDRHVMLARDGDEVDFRSQCGDEQITVAVHAPLFEALAGATLGPRFFDGTDADRLTLRDPLLKPQLNRRLLELLDRNMAQPARLRNDEYARAWEFQVLDAWLGDIAAPDCGFTPAVRHGAAREAESYLRDHLDRRVSVAELCVVTGVPKRTLMLGFADSFGISPLAFHKRLRLNAARRDLIRSWPNETSVTEVALRWGFEHLGRFSVEYRHMFGESPIMTLRG
jgi:AraC-like DNA-binding protein